MNMIPKPDSANSEYGVEMKITALSGRHITIKPPANKIIADLPKAMLAGKYLSITLHTILLNAHIQSGYSGVVRPFTLVELEYHNTWDYRVAVPSCIFLIDSSGMQHQASNKADYYEFTKLRYQAGAIAEINFHAPDFEIASHATTTGWIWFDKVLNGAAIDRISFQVDIFEPGQVSGLAQDQETLEFKINKYDLMPISARYTNINPDDSGRMPSAALKQISPLLKAEYEQQFAKTAKNLTLAGKSAAICIKGRNILSIIPNDSTSCDPIVNAMRRYSDMLDTGAIVAEIENTRAKAQTLVVELGADIVKPLTDALSDVDNYHLSVSALPNTLNTLKWLGEQIKYLTPD